MPDHIHAVTIEFLLPEMTQRTKEGEVLESMTATLNYTISEQLEPVRFGDVVSSAGFLSDQRAKSFTSAKGTSDYEKVSKITSAVVNHITSQSSPEMVTQQFDKFVLLLHDESLDGLANQLAGKRGE